MKKKNYYKYIGICMLIARMLRISDASAQYVTIPDTIFVNWLQSNGYAACMNGSQLDTTCPAVLNASSLACYAVPIRDLTGVQYFKNITYLDCSNDSLYSIPAFPAALTNINCDYNNLVSLPSLPANLNTLTCSSNYQLTSLPTLPANLNTLTCCNTYYLTSLPALPANLNTLKCANNYALTSLPALPANLSYLDCSYNQLSSLPTLPDSLGYLDCNDNELSSLPALPTNMTFLACDWNQLTSLPALPAALNILFCNTNQLSSLPNLPANLNNLDCSWNQVSSLPNLPANLAELTCFYNRLSSLPLLPANLNTLTCSDNQLSSLPSLPANLNTLTCSDNQLTSLPVLPATLGVLNCRHNQLSSLPALPDSLYYLICDSNANLSCLPVFKRIVNLSFLNTAITCLPDYGIVTSSTPPLSSLPLCGIFNPNGCQVFWNLSGQCFYTAASGCSFDSSSVGTNYVKTLLYSGGNLVQQTFSGGEGFYSFDSVAYGSYTVQVDTSNLPFTVSCPDSDYYTVTLSASDSLSYNNNFAFKCRTEGFDIGVQSALNNYIIPRPNARFVLNTIAGDMSELYGAHCAAGISGQVQIVYSGQLTYVGPAGSLAPTTVSGDTVTWTIADFGAVNDYTAFNLLFKVDSLATPGTQACFTFSLTPVAGDYNPGNNTLSYCFTIVNALDPNEKEVYPAAAVDTGGWLTYVIRFQNTGTATAVNIKITDTLDNNLDAATFQLLNYSAKNLTQIFGNLVVFNFPNINLPDSSASDSASRGFVQYKIKLKSGLTPGSNISNTAYIYFDLNPAVVTNTTLNTVAGPTGIASFAYCEMSIQLYPNPANDVLYIKTGGPQPQNTAVYDMSGRLIISSRFTSALNVKNLPSGVYLLEISAAEGVTRKRFVKM